MKIQIIIDDSEDQIALDAFDGLFAGRKNTTTKEEWAHKRLEMHVQDVVKAYENRRGNLDLRVQAEEKAKKIKFNK